MEFLFENVRAKTIDGFENYFITETGSLYRRLKTRTQPKKIGGYIHKDGYRQCYLSQDGKQMADKIHRLVAEVFIPNPNNLEAVDHIDENKLNNHRTNLRWVSHQDNAKYYNEKDGRKKFLDLMKKKKNELNKKMDEYEYQLNKYKKEEEKIRNEILKLTMKKSNIEKDIEVSIQRLKNENQRLTSQREGTVYGNVDDMVEATGVPCTINGVRYPSAGSAAQYIVDNYKDAAKKSTISKAIRRMLQGQREPWCMYEKFNIGRT